MSLSPEPPGGLTRPNSEPKSEPNSLPGSLPNDAVSLQNSPRPRIGWQRRLLRISLALFTFEIGITLVFFPWMPSWDLNYFQSLSPEIRNLWMQPSFRGALTGLGFVNIYIACLQAARSFRKS
jgi:hypothetical protein